MQSSLDDVMGIDWNGGKGTERHLFCFVREPVLQLKAAPRPKALYGEHIVENPAGTIYVDLRCFLR